MGNYKAVVIDFETTGLSPHYGDRTIEVGCVLISNSQIVDRFQSLMNPDMKISGFIADYIGITNKMLSTAPKIKDVMTKLKAIVFVSEGVKMVEHVPEACVTLSIRNHVDAIKCWNCSVIC